MNFYSRFYNLDNLLKPGKYKLRTSQSIPEIVGILVKGSNDLRIFTIPEGYTLSQIIDLLVKQGLADENLLKIALKNSRGYDFPFIKNIPRDITLEGYLFPDTYHIGSDTTEEQIVAMMLNRFQVEMTKLDFINKAAGRNLDLHQAVTIASLIEGEALIDKERPVIASVIFNRLKINMPLQIDATVKYALGGNKTKIYYRDLKVDSPYNTYLIRGLPPGPINSPGSVSMDAVINPAVTGYLYYVAKNDGSHAFSSSLQEHNNNISRYQ